MKAVIMAGGTGTRLMPLTKNTPKSLVKINGKPFLWYLIHNLKIAGITKIFIIFKNKKYKFKKFLKDYDFNAKLVCQPDPLGTAHALSLTKKEIGKGPFILAAGDQLFSTSDINSLIKSNKPFYVSSFEVQDSRKYGLIISKKNKLLEIVEKQNKVLKGEVNASLDKLDHRIFKYLPKVQISKRGEYELTYAISLMSKKEKIYVKKLKDFWIDLCSIEDIPKIEQNIEIISK